MCFLYLDPEEWPPHLEVDLTPTDTCTQVPCWLGRGSQCREAPGLLVQTHTPEPLSDFLGPTVGNQANNTWVFLPPALWVMCLEENIWRRSVKT